MVNWSLATKGETGISFSSSWHSFFFMIEVLVDFLKSEFWKLYCCCSRNECIKLTGFGLPREQLIKMGMYDE